MSASAERLFCPRTRTYTGHPSGWPLHYKKNGDSGGLVEPPLGDFIRVSARDFKKNHVLSVVAGSDDIPYSLIQINPMNSPDTTTCDACGTRYTFTNYKDRCPVCCPDQVKEDESDDYQLDDWGDGEDD